MANAYFSDDIGTLTLETDDSTPTGTPVAGIQNVEISADVSIESLYTGDSIKTESKKQHEAQVSVSIGYSKFDATVVNEWLDGDTQAGATAFADTTDPEKYQLTGTFTAVGGGTTATIEIGGITFESMPLISASRGEFVQWDLEGVGEDVTNFTVA